MPRPRSASPQRTLPAAQLRLTPELATALEAARAVVARRRPSQAPPSTAAVLEVALLELAAAEALAPPALDVRVLENGDVLVSRSRA